MKRVLLGLLAAAVCSVVVAEEVLNNAAIIELQGLNLGDAVIVEKIKTSKCSFDTSIAGLKQLKVAKVSDSVIQAMVAAGATTAKSTTAPATTGSADSNDPAAPHAAGVWMMKDKKLVRLESEVSGESSGGGFVGPWGIGRTAQTVHVAGPRSETQLTERKPVFYIYIGTSTAPGHPQGGAEFMAAESPREVALLRFRIPEKENNRVLEVGKGGA